MKRGFPAAIPTTGTRDLLLNNTVRAHRRPREAGVEAQFEVFEEISRAQHQLDDRVPETREALGEISAALAINIVSVDSCRWYRAVIHLRRPSASPEPAGMEAVVARAWLRFHEQNGSAPTEWREHTFVMGAP